MLSTVGGYSKTGQDLYFTKIHGNNITITFGMLGYCIQEKDTLQCIKDDTVKMNPNIETIPGLLNDTYPYLFTDAVTLDADAYPNSVSQPRHDPKIFPAAILAIICGGCSIIIGLLKVLFYHKVQDEHLSRSFFAWGAAVLSLLLIALTSVKYDEGNELLNLVYPHLNATLGPCTFMVGVSFAAFFLSGLSYMEGCYSSDPTDEGYEIV
ncbi:hypothetical protein BJ944DRAFT_172146 [Cunninghamella echinulata]|nr:hypothetical protein BJ944DRAFT_172146 [Cunninghamella echinulata]